MSRIFDSKQTPFAHEYYDDNENLLIDIVLTEQKFPMQKGKRFDIYRTNKQGKKRVKGIYAKIKNVEPMYNINNDYQGKKSCKISVKLEDPDNKIIKLCDDIDRIIKTKLCEMAGNDVLEPTLKLAYDREAKKVREDNITRQEYNDMIDATGNKKPHKPMGTVLLDNIVPKYYSACPDNNGTRIIKNAQLPLRKMKNPSGGEPKYILPDNPNIITGGHYGVNIVNYDNDMELRKAKRALHEGQMHDSENLSALEERVQIAAKNKKESDTIAWTWENIDKYIPIGTQIKYLGVKIQSVYISDTLVSVKVDCIHLYYTNENISSTCPLEDDDFDVDDVDQVHSEL